MRGTRLLPMVLVTACVVGESNDDPAIISALSGTASISLSGSSARATQTSDTSWSLNKTGSITGNTASWTITATKGAVASGHLVIQGQMTVQNTGSGPATIGNIVVNLQTKSGSSWVTRSSDVANATDGDAATTAKIHKAASSESKTSFTENTASGELEFMDATNNTVFSLVPQVMIGAGQSRTLLFAAAFDNNVLNLAAGTPIRAEVIVSFGNATASGNSTANVDINGSGSLDADETRVRSVPARLTLTVPAPTAGNAAVTLTDTLSDIVATGSVTYSNVSFNLGATSGTVTAIVVGGTTGGTITNCAHLTSPSSTVTSGGFTFPLVTGVDLTACSTLTIGATTCTPGTVGCAWRPGDINTRSQSGWDSTTNWFSAYDARYASTFGEIEVGVPGTGGFSMLFSGPTFIQDYLVAAGTLGALSADLLDPTMTSSGTFGGEVLALQLNVELSLALGGTSAIPFGGLTLCNMTDASLNNRTVANYLGLVSTLLGGGSNGYSITTMSPLTAQLNSAFAIGGVSSFAQTHLVNGACP